VSDYGSGLYGSGPYGGVTMTLTATAEPGNVPPRVRLELVWTEAGTTATISRLDPDNRARVVRSGDPAAIVAFAWTGYDYESWLGEPTTYQAQVGATIVTSNTVTLEASVPWLRHVGTPSLSMQADVSGDGSPDYKLTRAVFSPIGRQYPIVVTDGRRTAKATTMAIHTWTLAEREALLNLLADGSVLLYDVPSSLGWGITHDYIAPGDLTETREVPSMAGVPYRSWALPYDVVDTPATGAGPAWTYGGVLIGYATYSTVKTSFASYADLLGNVPA
jgi:hypothetical protein